MAIATDSGSESMDRSRLKEQVQRALALKCYLLYTQFVKQERLSVISHFEKQNSINKHDLHSQSPETL